MAIDIPQILPKEITDKYTTVSNSFISKEKEFETEIGDVKQAEFQPQIKIKRWDNECNFSVRLIDLDPDIPTIIVSKNKIEWKKDKLEAHFYNVGELAKEKSEQEFEIMLNTE